MVAKDFFERRLDDKNRLTLPPQLREEFEGQDVVLTRGFGKYIHMYTQTVWDAQMEPALQGDILDERVADLNVRFRRGQMTAVMDNKQGRITLDSSLLDYANIDREVVAVRAGNYWRIMNPEVADSF